MPLQIGEIKVRTNGSAHLLPSASTLLAAVYAADSGKVTFQMIFDEEATRVEKLNLHIDLSSTSLGFLLQPGNHVAFEPLSAFVVGLSIGSGLVVYRQGIRPPVTERELLQNLRMSSSLPEPQQRTFYQAVLILSTECLLTVASRSSNILDAAEWNLFQSLYLLSLHSVREKEMCIRYVDPCIQVNDLRFDLKHMLSQLFHRCGGLAGEKQQTVFGLVPRGEAVPVMMIFISSLRLDLTRAILPSPANLRSERTQELLREIRQKRSTYEVGDATLAFWKHARTSFAERCRDREHTTRCEYTSQDPSTVLATKTGGNITCLCGLGKFPKDYRSDLSVWTSAAEHCVRQAISPCYSVPVVEKAIEEDCKIWNRMAKEVGNLNLKKEGC
ncbi:uncharacterized protein Z519_08228 [Cladophialophora bantiana CBS 173.52]|uniref:Uncharacterized protein n=1 Tax=Cladophialophora bantiana (strain ATCC 10958 / CBS 173.52 / CDC B-1940 / NIH 8579) TaxID=1442370 RepID=A0A0D2FXY3_CLAB1|nr:uncharacterized protein Z519_08228 [Cladophialophora bantiana CBS 173.52]KIW91332.1 hypothetical protein Z519_08228 [Cladophialophora bantiana CBS 173.52]